MYINDVFLDTFERCFRIGDALPLVAVAAAAVGVSLGVVAVKGCEDSFEGGGRGHIFFRASPEKTNPLYRGSLDPSFFSKK